MSKFVYVLRKADQLGLIFVGQHFVVYISVVVDDHARLCHTSFQPPEYLTLHQSPQACIMEALLHGHEYLTMHHIHGVS